ncbi:glycoside hydrolase family 3 C-terminal domain-containing protein [Actinomadura kijaniata]|uniref:Beta-glucosidase n=1 Tax=Actinomadura namibiensis TaxID=182080 RepID=A0A7W3QNY2_ACTNM|nr:glycoside hydrolase family 3 C-terminal domain-containing protein [Actinomadura namibiensis]MBA8953533.1 beta-glucosidase [Actinomadura namibiensis]
MGAAKRWIAATGSLASALALLSAPAPAQAAERCGDPARRPWCDTKLTPDRRAALLLAKLTGDEKIGLLASDDPFGGPLGGISENAHADTSHGVPRLGVPPLYMADGPAGVRQGRATALPAPIAMAAAFDEDAAARYGATVGWEARHRGNDVLFGPTVDVLRAPLNGRAFEGLGEDPHLSSRTAAAWVRGLQRQGVMASVKHLAVYTQETDRLELRMRVDPRTLREIYLPPFEAAVRQGGAATVMCGFGQVNGRWACEDGGVLTGILRGEWGFQGFVVSDHTALHDATRGINGGLDMELPVGLRYNAWTLGRAVQQRKVTWATIDGRVRAILRTMFAFGVFDRAAHPNDLTRADRAASEETARRVAESGMTLLKNAGGILPLKAPKSIALVGRGAVENPSGFGSAKVEPFTQVTPRDSIARRAGNGTTVTHHDGHHRAAAVEAARRADVAVVFVSDTQGEFFDKSCLTLTCARDPLKGDQDGLVADVAAANPDTIVVLETGGPVLTPWAGRVRGVVQAWYPGQRGGEALARVLYGDVDPGGRLPMTFPAAGRDAPLAGNPAQYPGVDKTVTFSEGVMVGYRHYDARRLTPRFPFGHGLSYTTFRYGGLSVRPDRVQVTVTNTGKRPGYAVPQMYLGLPSPRAGIPQPPRQLKGYDKVLLAPGASARVTFPITSRSLAYWDEAARGWRVARGCYAVGVGSSSRDLPLTGRFGQRGAAC